MRVVGRREAVPGQDGFTLIELVVALGLLAVVATGLMVSVGLGFRTVAVARQRTTASELATQRLENLRNVPFERIAINRSLLQPTDPLLAYSADPTSPNFFVSGDGSQYDVTGNGDYESLIIDDANGEIDYIDDPIQVGSTVMDVYQYATWVDDDAIAGTQDYRRITVVIRYKAPAAAGINKLLRSSTLFTPGTVLIPSPLTTVPAGTTTIPATTTTIPSSTTTTTVSGSCSGDTAAPVGSFTIGGSTGAETGFTAATSVSLQLSLTDGCTPMIANFSNDGATWGADVVYDPLSQQVSWSLPSGNGTKTVFANVRDGAGNSASLTAQTVILDATAPTAPASVLHSASCSGSTRTVNLSWVASTDGEGNLRGYRVYRSTDGVSWSQLTATTSTTASDSHSKTLNSVRYYVVAYDKAGNVSTQAPSPVISFGKNQCS